MQVESKRDSKDFFVYLNKFCMRKDDFKRENGE